MNTLPNNDIYATDVSLDDERLVVRLADRRTVSVPLDWFPRLAQATDEQRQHWEFIGHGTGIHWEEIDEDISIAGLLGLPTD